jgi:phosphatidylinositol kinase/protein kinase (PI-3  family)
MFKQAQVPCWLRPYKIISTGNSTGLIAVSPISMLSETPSLSVGHRVTE